MKTIQDEIRELTEAARQLGHQIRNPRTCPRLAAEAEERYRFTIAKLADLQAKTTDAAAQP